MSTLSQMLEDYRNGERGLPSYDELAALVASLSMQPVALPDAMVIPDRIYYGPVCDNEDDVSHAEGWNAFRGALLKGAGAAKEPS